MTDPTPATGGLEAAHPSRPDRRELARVTAAVEAWIDEAPEQTAGLDLLRQIIQPALSSAGSDALDRERAKAAGEALREAADAWTQGQWSDVLLPKPTPPAVPVIAYANGMGDWLRARAAAVSPEGGGDRG
jgi:hypothetical protein